MIVKSPVTLVYVTELNGETTSVYVKSPLTSGLLLEGIPNLILTTSAFAVDVASQVSMLTQSRSPRRDAYFVTLEPLTCVKQGGGLLVIL